MQKQYVMKRINKTDYRSSNAHVTFPSAAHSIFPHASKCDQHIGHSYEINTANQLSRDKSNKNLTGIRIATYPFHAREPSLRQGRLRPSEKASAKHCSPQERGPMLSTPPMLFYIITCTVPTTTRCVQVLRSRHIQPCRD